MGHEHDWAVVHVADNGVGIPIEVLTHVFECFYRIEDTRTCDVDGGTSTGLVISRVNARAYGGDPTTHSDGPDHDATPALILSTVTSQPDLDRPLPGAPSGPDRLEDMSTLSRYHVLFTDLGLAPAGALSAYDAKNTPAAAPAAPNSPLTIPNQAPLVAAPGTKIVDHVLTPQPITLDLGGVTARTWAYNETLDAPVLWARAGDLLQVRVENKLPTSTSVH